MEITQVRWLVTLEGIAEPIEVSTDQRDFAAFEAVAENGEVNVRHFTTHRHWCWTAMRRRGFIAQDVTWAKFNEELCIEVASVPAPEAEAAAESEDEQGLDPGR